MKDDEASPLGEALVLIAIAGSVDAIGFLRLGQLFVSFISGDTTKLSVAASQGDWSAAAAPGGIVGSFVLGDHRPADQLCGRALVASGGATVRGPAAGSGGCP